MTKRGAVREHQIRQCIHCRVRAPKEELLRFVFVDGAFKWDKTHKEQTRGVYVHSRIECLSKGIDVGRWVRAVRLDASGASKIRSVDVTKVLQEAYAEELRRI